MHLRLSILAGLALLLFSLAAASHHSFSAEFDVGRPVELIGTVTRIEWTNPHAWLHIETVDAQGDIQSWSIELLGINSLIRNGLSPQTVKPGDGLTIKGFGARDGSNTANASAISRTQTGETVWPSEL